MEPYVQVVPTHMLGESPHWNAAKQELLYVDILAKDVHRYVPSTGEHTRVHIEEGEVDFVVPVEGQPDRYVVAFNRDLQLMEWDGQSSTPSSLVQMFTVEPDKPTNHWNDGKCDVNGRLWAGTMSDNSIAGSLYRVTDSVQLVQTPTAISNGMAWNKSNSLMYYIDSLTAKVDVFDFNNDLGTISNRRTVYDFNETEEDGLPDGMTIDSNDNIWVACFGGKQVIQVDPSTGKKIQSIPMPTDNITSIAFGGANLDIMYVTSGTDALSEKQRLLQPTGGALFQITNTGSKGQGGGNNYKM